MRSPPVGLAAHGLLEPYSACARSGPPLRCSIVVCCRRSTCLTPSILGACRMGRWPPLLLILCALIGSASAVRFRIHETNLEKTRTSPIYRAHLRAGYELLNAWLVNQKLSGVRWTENVKHTNQILADFIQEMHDNKSTKLWLVRHALRWLRWRMHVCSKPPSRPNGLVLRSVPARAGRRHHHLLDMHGVWR